MRIKKFRPREHHDKLIYGDGIVNGIVLLAVSEIPYAEIYRGVSGKLPKEKAVNVVIDKSSVTVDVAVTIQYSQSVSDMAFMIQEAVKYNVESMTEYSVAAVNVIVKGVTFDEVTPVAKEGVNLEDKSSAEQTSADAKQQVKD
ncbi:MAG: Asp23/Gls24 family envelope stress response protein [Clostridia bacterium]|nr:Asp23/Gls24 family envelope stress response protein [Clostridia bacterium]